MDADSARQVGTWVAFLLTIMVYCYLGREITFFRSVYRAATYLFIGVALGYGVVMAWHSVLLPRMFHRLQEGQWLYVVPLVFCLLLLTKLTRAWGGAGNLSLAFVLGIGAALAVGGALVGTLIPQVEATFLSLNPGHYKAIAAREGELPLTFALNALLVVTGVVSTLLYFYFTGRGETNGGRLGCLLRFSSGFGRVFIMLTFGVLFASIAISRLSLLVERVRFILETLWSLVPVS